MSVLCFEVCVSPPSATCGPLGGIWNALLDTMKKQLLFTSLVVVVENDSWVLTPRLLLQHELKQHVVSLWAKKT